MPHSIMIIQQGNWELEVNSTAALQRSRLEVSLRASEVRDTRAGSRCRVDSYYNYMDILKRVSDWHRLSNVI
jgi:hypothetical protein